MKEGDGKTRFKTFKNNNNEILGKGLKKECGSYNQN